MLLLSDEQIEAARSVDVLAYFERHAPGSIRKSSPNEYCLVEHPSGLLSLKLYQNSPQKINYQKEVLDKAV